MGQVFCRGCGEIHCVPFHPSREDLACPTCGATMGALPKERKPLERKPETRLKRSAPKTKRQRSISPASPAQRAKVAELGFCIACLTDASEYVAIDPAHLCPRGRGGCDHRLCVVGLCRHANGGCHRLFDEGQLDLLKVIAERWPAHRPEVQHMLEHMNPVAAIQRLANDRTQWDGLAA